MKKRMFSAVFVVMLLAFLLPLEVHAFGGFVSPKGSDTYHDIYCFLVEGYNLNELRWYDTASQAESAGLKPCEECDAANGFEFHYDLETCWKTNDHLIQSAMELESEIAYLAGYDTGYEEGFWEAESMYEDSWRSAETGEESGYAEGYEDGENYGYDHGYDNGYDDGCISGKEDGYEIGYEEGFDEGAESAKPDLALLLIGAVVCVSIGYYYGKRKAESDFSSSAEELTKLRSENAFLRKSLSMLNKIAKDVGRSPENMLDTLYVSLMMKQGYSEDEAKLLLSKRKME